MENSIKIKEMVREKYEQIAQQDSSVNASSCCGATNSSSEVYNIMSESYESLQGYAPEADLGLGCGIPTEFAGITEGQTVLDLGSGAGNDCFVARKATGNTGKVIGVDFSSAMLKRARENADKLAYNNVEFREGDIEQLPVTEETIDVVLSNCVLNLVPNKPAVFAEIFRVLKPRGHFSISDVVLEGQLPEALKKDAEMYAGCVSGAIQKDIYLSEIKNAGFENIIIGKQKAIYLPDDILTNYLTEDELFAFRKGETGIFSITVKASKPMTNNQIKTEAADKRKISLTDLSCSPNSGCC